MRMFARLYYQSATAASSMSARDGAHDGEHKDRVLKSSRPAGWAICTPRQTSSRGDPLSQFAVECVLYPLYVSFNGVPVYDDLYYKIVVQGIADAIENAHESLQPAL
jgi:hypothetical protein